MSEENEVLNPAVLAVVEDQPSVELSIEEQIQTLNNQYTTECAELGDAYVKLHVQLPEFVEKKLDSIKKLNHRVSALYKRKEEEKKAKA